MPDTDARRAADPMLAGRMLQSLASCVGDDALCVRLVAEVAKFLRAASAAAQGECAAMLLVAVDAGRVLDELSRLGDAADGGALAEVVHIVHFLLGFNVVDQREFVAEPGRVARVLDVALRALSLPAPCDARAVLDVLLTILGVAPTPSDALTRFFVCHDAAAPALGPNARRLLKLLRRHGWEGMSAGVWVKAVRVAAAVISLKDACPPTDGASGSTPTSPLRVKRAVQEGPYAQLAPALQRLLRYVEEDGAWEPEAAALCVGVMHDVLKAPSMEDLRQLLAHGAAAGLLAWCGSARAATRRAGLSTLLCLLSHKANHGLRTHGAGEAAELREVVRHLWGRVEEQLLSPWGGGGGPLKSVGARATCDEEFLAFFIIGCVLLQKEGAAAGDGAVVAQLTEGITPPKVAMWLQKAAARDAATQAKARICSGFVLALALAGNPSHAAFKPSSLPWGEAVYAALGAAAAPSAEAYLTPRQLARVGEAVRWVAQQSGGVVQDSEPPARASVCAAEAAARQALRAGLCDALPGLLCSDEARGRGALGDVEVEERVGVAVRCVVEGETAGRDGALRAEVVAWRQLRGDCDLSCRLAAYERGEASRRAAILEEAAAAWRACTATLRRSHILDSVERDDAAGRTRLAADEAEAAALLFTLCARSHCSAAEAAQRGAIEAEEATALFPLRACHASEAARRAAIAYAEAGARKTLACAVAVQQETVGRRPLEGEERSAFHELSGQWHAAGAVCAVQEEEAAGRGRVADEGVEEYAALQNLLWDELEAMDIATVEEPPPATEPAGSPPPEVLGTPGSLPLPEAPVEPGAGGAAPPTDVGQSGGSPFEGVSSSASTSPASTSAASSSPPPGLGGSESPSLSLATSDAGSLASSAAGSCGMPALGAVLEESETVGGDAEEWVGEDAAAGGADALNEGLEKGVGVDVGVDEQPERGGGEEQAGSPVAPPSAAPSSTESPEDLKKAAQMYVAAQQAQREAQVRAERRRIAQAARAKQTALRLEREREQAALRAQIKEAAAAARRAKPAPVITSLAATLEGGCGTSGRVSAPVPPSSASTEPAALQEAVPLQQAQSSASPPPWRDPPPPTPPTATGEPPIPAPWPQDLPQPAGDAASPKTTATTSSGATSAPTADAAMPAPPEELPPPPPAPGSEPPTPPPLPLLLAGVLRTPRGALGTGRGAALSARASEAATFSLADDTPRRHSVQVSHATGDSALFIIDSDDDDDDDDVEDEDDDDDSDGEGNKVEAEGSDFFHLSASFAPIKKHSPEDVEAPPRAVATAAAAEIHARYALWVDEILARESAEDWSLEAARRISIREAEAAERGVLAARQRAAYFALTELSARYALWTDEVLRREGIESAGAEAAARERLRVAEATQRVGLAALKHGAEAWERVRERVRTPALRFQTPSTVPDGMAQPLPLCGQEELPRAASVPSAGPSVPSRLGDVDSLTQEPAAGPCREDEGEAAPVVEAADEGSFAGGRLESAIEALIDGSRSPSTGSTRDNVAPPDGDVVGAAAGVADVEMHIPERHRESAVEALIRHSPERTRLRSLGRVAEAQAQESPSATAGCAHDADPQDGDGGAWAEACLVVIEAEAAARRDVLAEAESGSAVLLQCVQRVAEVVARHALQVDEVLAREGVATVFDEVCGRAALVEAEGAEWESTGLQVVCAEESARRGGVAEQAEAAWQQVAEQRAEQAEAAWQQVADALASRPPASSPAAAMPCDLEELHRVHSVLSIGSSAPSGVAALAVVEAAARCVDASATQVHHSVEGTPMPEGLSALEMLQPPLECTASTGTSLPDGLSPFCVLQSQPLCDRDELHQVASALSGGSSAPDGVTALDVLGVAGEATLRPPASTEGTPPPAGLSALVLVRGTPVPEGLSPLALVRNADPRPQVSPSHRRESAVEALIRHSPERTRLRSLGRVAEAQAQESPSTTAGCAHDADPQDGDGGAWAEACLVVIEAEAAARRDVLAEAGSGSTVLVQCVQRVAEVVARHALQVDEVLAREGAGTVFDEVCGRAALVEGEGAEWESTGLQVVCAEESARRGGVAEQAEAAWQQVAEQRAREVPFVWFREQTAAEEALARAAVEELEEEVRSGVALRWKAASSVVVRPEEPPCPPISPPQEACSAPCSTLTSPGGRAFGGFSTVVYPGARLSPKLPAQGAPAPPVGPEVPRPRSFRCLRGVVDVHDAAGGALAFVYEHSPRRARSLPAAAAPALDNDVDAAPALDNDVEVSSDVDLTSQESELGSYAAPSPSLPCRAPDAPQCWVERPCRQDTLYSVLPYPDPFAPGCVVETPFGRGAGGRGEDGHDGGRSAAAADGPDADATMVTATSTGHTPGGFVDRIRALQRDDATAVPEAACEAVPQSLLALLDGRQHPAAVAAAPADAEESPAPHPALLESSKLSHSDTVELSLMLRKLQRAGAELGVGAEEWKMWQRQLCAMHEPGTQTFKAAVERDLMRVDAYRGRLRALLLVIETREGLLEQIARQYHPLSTRRNFYTRTQHAVLSQRLRSATDSVRDALAAFRSDAHSPRHAGGRHLPFMWNGVDYEDKIARDNPYRAPQQYAPRVKLPKNPFTDAAPAKAGRSPDPAGRRALKQCRPRRVRAERSPPPGPRASPTANLL